MDNENNTEVSSTEVKDNPNPATEEKSTTTVEDKQETSPTFNTPDFDADEITRKLDGIIEQQGILSKAIMEMMTKKVPVQVEPTSTTRPNSDTLPIKDINDLNL
jgi:cytoskeletal protein RodZ